MKDHVGLLYRDGFNTEQHKSMFMKDAIAHEKAGNYKSMVHGLDSGLVSQVPVTEQTIANISPLRASDPYLMIRDSYDGVNNGRTHFPKKKIYGTSRPTALKLPVPQLNDKYE